MQDRYSGPCPQTYRTNMAAMAAIKDRKVDK